MARILMVAVMAMLLAGCETLSPNASVQGNSDGMRGGAGIGIAL